LFFLTVFELEGDKCMSIEATLIKPLVDAIVAAFNGGRRAVARSKAEKELREALSELWQVSPDISKAEAGIIGAELAGLISSDLLQARDRLEKVKRYRSKRVARKAAKKSVFKKRVKKVTRKGSRGGRRGSKS
jgi:hypothetical protein